MGFLVNYFFGKNWHILDHLKFDFINEFALQLDGSEILLKFVHLDQ